MKQYKVVKGFNDSREGDLVWLNDRRAKSELRNGNVSELKVEKVEIKTKEEKIVVQNKKAPVNRKRK